MRRCILNSIIALFCSGMVAVSNAQSDTFICPTLHENQLYHYHDWIKEDGSKTRGGEWNSRPILWRLWVHGDTYLTPKHRAVHTFAMAAHYYKSTNTWYLKCISADSMAGPRTNVWTYNNCFILDDKSGFKCD